MRSREVHLIERPQGLPVPQQFRIVEADVAEPAEGQLLVENIYISVDPAMRPRLAGPAALNEAMMGGAIGRVLKSRNALFQEGDHVESMMRGFVFYEFESKREQFLKDMKDWIRHGRVKYRTTILQGIGQAPTALIGLFTGANTGKMVVQLAKD